MRLWTASGALVCVLAAPLSGAAASAAAGGPPIIRHEPVARAAAGQPLWIRGAVSAPAGRVREVHLYYSTSRDAAPFKLPMQDAGVGIYVGEIPGEMLKDLTEVAYYLEAVDDQDQRVETPWYRVRLQAAGAEGAAAPADDGGGGAGRSSWTRPALYAGGAAALLGAGLWAANRDSGDGSSSSTVTNTGTYSGAVTICLEFQGQAPECASHAMSIQIVSSGIVSSDNLYEGQHLEGRLTGDEFILRADVTESNLTGEVVFEGTVVDARIVGTVGGTAVAASGERGTYSGSFTARKP